MTSVASAVRPGRAASPAARRVAPRARPQVAPRARPQAAPRMGPRTAPRTPRNQTTPAMPADLARGETVALMGSEAEPCTECRRPLASGDLRCIEEGAPLCLTCAVLDRLVLLPSGDVALTRWASGHSRLRVVVLEWSRRYKRYERRGTLVEPEALARARVACEADAGERAQQRQRAAVRREVEDQEFVVAFRRAILAQFPGCPMAEARDIAAHACAKYSGRVGRTAAARAMDAVAVRLAVTAHVRHLHTDYDQILDRTGDRRGTRARIRADVTAVLHQWGQAVSRDAAERDAVP